MMSEVLRDDSKWSPYLAVLPTELNSLIFWSCAELAELQGSAVLDKIGKSEAEHMFHQKVMPLGLNGGTIKLFHQIASTIMAYAFDIPDSYAEGDDDDCENTVLTMIPLADMLNADGDLNNSHLIYGNRDLEMRSIKPIRKGYEILNDYGMLPRSDLLRRYGYVTDNYAPYDVAELSTNFILSAFRSGKILDTASRAFDKVEGANFDGRLELSKRMDIYEDAYDICHASSEEPCLPDELVGFLYLLLVNQETLATMKHSESALSSRSNMETELLGAVIGQLLRMRENEYATSLEEDEAILSAGHCSYRIMMAVKVRQGEKLVLRDAMAEAASFRGSNRLMRAGNEKRSIEAEAPNQPKRSKHR